MTAITLCRDARHLALPQVREDGQRRTGAGTALLIGLRGIGCAMAKEIHQLAVRRRGDCPACSAIA